MKTQELFFYVLNVLVLILHILLLRIGTGWWEHQILCTQKKILKEHGFLILWSESGQPQTLVGHSGNIKNVSEDEWLQIIDWLWLKYCSFFNFYQLFVSYSDSFIHQAISVSSCYAHRVIDWENREHRERHGQAGREKQMYKKGEEREREQVREMDMDREGKVRSARREGRPVDKRMCWQAEIYHLTVHAGTDKERAKEHNR